MVWKWTFGPRNRKTWEMFVFNEAKGGMARASRLLQLLGEKWVCLVWQVGLCEMSALAVFYWSFGLGLPVLCVGMYGES